MQCCSAVITFSATDDGGRIIILGQSGERLGEDMSGGEIYLGGKLVSLGSDAMLTDISQDEIESVMEFLDRHEIRYVVAAAFHQKRLVREPECYDFGIERYSVPREIEMLTQVLLSKFQMRNLALRRRFTIIELLPLPDDEPDSAAPTTATPSPSAGARADGTAAPPPRPCWVRWTRP